MQVLCKAFAALIFFFLFSNLIYAELDECKGTIDADEVPCAIYLPVNVSSTNCNAIEVQFYNLSISLYNQTMTNYTDFLCNGTFNQTNIGTYPFYYTNGDSGSIIVEEGRIMIYLLYFAIGLAALLFIAGYVVDNPMMVSLSGVLLMVFGIFIHINGFNTLNNLITEALAIISIMFGMFCFIVPWLNHIDMRSILEG